VPSPSERFGTDVRYERDHDGQNRIAQNGHADNNGSRGAAQVRWIGLSLTQR
jgi:hypothetical protein